MYRLEKTTRDHDRFLSPSFSSTLLEQIYRSIDEGETKKSGETKFYREQQTASFKKPKPTDRKQNNNRLRTEKVVVVAKETTTDINRKSRHQQRDADDADQDVLFFSSTSISSSDSSCSGGGFSSSDTESIMSRASCFAPPQNPKPVRTTTSASFRLEKEKHGTRVFDGLCRDVDHAKQGTEIRGGEEALLIKNKSRALKIYNNLKKMKQPISPGGRLTSFLNSLFATTGIREKSSSRVDKTTSSNAERKINSAQASTCSTTRSCLSKTTSSNAERKINSAQASTCSSTRSCLSKTTSSTCNGGNKTVRFSLAEEKESRVVKEAARKFLKEYRNNNHKKNDLVLKDLPLPIDHDDDDDDDVASCDSSDLFELDHLAVFGNSTRYCEELPVYETTHVSSNRAIANRLLV